MNDISILPQALEHIIQKIRVKIRETPVGPKSVVDAYHFSIIEELDSLPISCEVTRNAHKMLHQEMWIQGHKVYDRYPTDSAAALDFIGIKVLESGQPKNLRSGWEGVQKARFDIWYAQKYLLSISEDQRDKWIIKAIKEADEEAQEYFYLRVDEVDILKLHAK